MGSQQQQLWTEKYRPINFSTFLGQKDIIRKVQAMVGQQNIPHLLFAGPAGTGKTTLSLMIAKQIFGDTWKHNLLELNASDDRGIDIVRNQIKDFARTKSLGTDLPKIIYLDECDSLTKEAQQALRRTMETYSHNTRFILSCNYSSKIIDPIQSRCAVFRFKPLQQEDIRNIINNIVKGENITIEKEAQQLLTTITEGDVRKTINILQGCAAVSPIITKKLVYETVGVAQPEEVREALVLAINKDFLKARDRLLNVMLNHGLSGLDIIKQIQQEIWKLDIPDERRVALTEKCGEVEFRMVEGSDAFLQLESLLASFVLAKP